MWSRLPFATGAPWARVTTDSDSGAFAEMNTTGHALVRFWWLVVAGLVAGAITAAVVLKAEAAPTRVATTKILVNSPSEPYLRTQQTGVSPQVSTVHPARSRRGGKSKAGLQPAPKLQAGSATAPDTSTLVTAANLYPLLIKSRAVERLRDWLYGRLPGKLTAKALNATTNTYGVYRPSTLPVVEVTATARSSRKARRLLDATVAAFGRWIVTQQRLAHIPRAQRISVQQLDVPALSTTGGRSKGLPIFVGALVFLAFCGAAIVADRARPARAEGGAKEPPPRTAATPNLDG